MTENADGTVTLGLGDRQFLVPAVVAGDVTAAVRDHADDPQALEQTISSIVADRAGGSDDAELATAVAALAIVYARDRSASVDAIVRGALAGNQAISAETLLTAIAEAGLDPRAQSAAERQLAVVLAPVIVAGGAAAQEQSPVTENADGTVTIGLDDRQFLVPAVVAEDIAAAVRDHADDPQALELAICSIVADRAGGSDDAELATAVAALAIVYARGRSASVDAIVRGALACNQAISAETLLTAIAEAGLDPRAQSAAERQLAELQATLEDQRQISPVE